MFQKTLFSVNNSQQLANNFLKSDANMPTIFGILQENPQLFGIWSGIFCDLVI